MCLSMSWMIRDFCSICASMELSPKVHSQICIDLFTLPVEFESSVLRTCGSVLIFGNSKLSGISPVSNYVSFNGISWTGICWAFLTSSNSSYLSISGSNFENRNFYVNWYMRSSSTLSSMSNIGQLHCWANSSISYSIVTDVSNPMY